MPFLKKRKTRQFRKHTSSLPSYRSEAQKSRLGIGVYSKGGQHHGFVQPKS